MKQNDKSPSNPSGISLGDVARDRISGYQGVVIGDTAWEGGSQFFTLASMNLNESGCPHRNHVFPGTQLELVRNAAVQVGGLGQDFKMSIGDAVQDTITGFNGTIVALTHNLDGTWKATVQPSTLNRKGNPSNAVLFSSSTLRRIDANQLTTGQRSSDRSKELAGTAGKIS